MLTGKPMEHTYKLSSPCLLPGSVVGVHDQRKHIQFLVHVGNGLAVSPAEAAHASYAWYITEVA